MEIISINQNNIDNEHICCAIGNDKQNQSRAVTKKEWMRARFSEGLVFKRFDERGKLFIEYMPIETVWKPISGKNYMVINCLWVSGQFKGKGLSKKLLNECIEDSRAKGMDGIAVVTSNKVKPFLTDKKFYLKHGFELVDTAFPYFELLVLKFNAAAGNPKFFEAAKFGTCTNQDGFTFVYSNQCPFMEEYTGILTEVLKRKLISFQVIKLDKYADAQQFGSPFGTFGIYYNGRFITHELMPEKKFEKFVEELI
jgi:ribosomal protein S18 acetylase RimI-like enzyme